MKHSSVKGYSGVDAIDLLLLPLAQEQTMKDAIK
jgi:hypothetical protein